MTTTRGIIEAPTAAEEIAKQIEALTPAAPATGTGTNPPSAGPTGATATTTSPAGKGSSLTAIDRLKEDLTLCEGLLSLALELSAPGAAGRLPDYEAKWQQLAKGAVVLVQAILQAADAGARPEDRAVSALLAASLAVAARHLVRAGLRDLRVPGFFTPAADVPAKGARP